MKAKKSPSIDLDNIIPLLINVWRRFHKEAGPGDRLQTREFRRVVESLKKLKAIIADPKEEKKSSSEQNYFADRELLSAYLLYPWLIHYQEALSVIGELPFTPRRVLDVCSGPGAFAFAALRHGATEVYATDRNLLALELAAEVCGRYGMPLNIRRWDCSKEHLTIEGSFDLITLGYGLNELFPKNMKGWKEKRLNFIHYLLSRLTTGGMLLLVEGSQGEDNRHMLELREQLVTKGVAIQAPCVWQGECPALKTPNSPCYALREMEKPFLIKEFQRALDINLSSLKMSYLLIKSPAAVPLGESELKLYRVVSPPIESYQGKRFYLCGHDGKKSIGSHLKEHPASSRAFEYLKRGELIEIQDALVQGQSLEIIEGTQIKVRAACGKPLPAEGSQDEDSQ